MPGWCSLYKRPPLVFNTMDQSILLRMCKMGPRRRQNMKTNGAKSWEKDRKKLPQWSWKEQKKKKRGTQKAALMVTFFPVGATVDTCWRASIDWKWTAREYGSCWRATSVCATAHSSTHWRTNSLTVEEFKQLPRICSITSLFCAACFQRCHNVPSHPKWFLSAFFLSFIIFLNFCLRHPSKVNACSF